MAVTAVLTRLLICTSSAQRASVSTMAPTALGLALHSPRCDLQNSAAPTGMLVMPPAGAKAGLVKSTWSACAGMARMNAAIPTATAAAMNPLNFDIVVAP
jgi:hypothetical protein